MTFLDPATFRWRVVTTDFLGRGSSVMHEGEHQARIAWDGAKKDFTQITGRLQYIPFPMDPWSSWEIKEFFNRGKPNDHSPRAA